ncbi:MAG: ROK family protein [Georgenia sp.]
MPESSAEPQLGGHVAGNLVIGVDVGGTKIAAAAVDADGRCGRVLTIPTPASAGANAVLDAIAEAVRRVAASVGDVPRAIGIGTAGVVDSDRGVIISATSVFPGWVGTAVGQQTSRRLADLLPGGPAVFVENDVDAHAAGEAWRGAARGARSALLVAVGTGVGAAVVLDGRTWRGAHHLAGEIGHMPIPGAQDLPCPCGRQGHLEAIGAGPALHRLYLGRGGDCGCVDTREVLTRADEGDEIAVRAVRDSAAAVGRAIAGVATVLDPEVVVVGGGMATAGGLWWSAMDAAVRAEVVDALQVLPVRPAELGGAAPLIGAARRAWASIHELDGARR